MNIIITDHADWSIEQIVEACLDRYQVEESFRQCKDKEIVSVTPLWHWTDSKIRCHFLTCLIALTYLRLVELKLEEAGCPMTANRAIESMKALHSCITLGGEPDKRLKATRLIEQPTEIQEKILRAFGYQVRHSVLQKIKS